MQTVANLSHHPAPFSDLDVTAANVIRGLAMDAVQAADSGHPGMPMGMATVAHVLWTRFLRHNPADPKWLNRDRFILSAGHGSMLLYALLHLAGYDVPLAQLKQFRQLGSITPGHPEYGVTPGVDTTTGPLGQGFATGVGMALAEAFLAANFNRPGYALLDHYTYAICSDGDLEEGISHEAASLAGHLGLGKLIYFYDDNNISIDGPTSLSYSDNVPLALRGVRLARADRERLRYARPLRQPSCRRKRRQTGPLSSSARRTSPMAARTSRTRLRRTARRWARTKSA